MKRIIFLSLISCLMFGTYCSAQVDLTSGSAGYTTDSMRNSETSYLTTPAKALDKIGVPGKYDLQYVAYNDSATTSITLVLQSSLYKDGIFTNHFGTTGTNCATCDSLTTGSVTSSDSVTKFWRIQPLQPYSKTDSTQVYTQSGRRLYFRVKQVHANGGKSRSKARLLTSE